MIKTSEAFDSARNEYIEGYEEKNKPASTMPLPIITMAAIILRKLSCGCWGVSFFLVGFTTSILFGNGVTFCISYPFTDIIYKNRIKHNHGLIKVKLWR